MQGFQHRWRAHTPSRAAREGKKGWAAAKPLGSREGWGGLFNWNRKRNRGTMLKLPRNRVACVPIRDSSDSGIKGYENAEPALGYQKPKSGNIILHDAYRERVDQGIVKYVGAGVTREKNGFGVGDMVIFSGYSGELVSIEGEGLFIILPARFIVACIIPEPTVVSGLFFKVSSQLSASLDEYFPATYEKAMELIAQALEETSTLKIEKDRPKLKDYSEVEEDDA